MRALTLALACALSAGCTVEELDLSGRACPCVEGWVCDTARDVCVEAVSGMDAGGSDAGRDAGRDAGGDAGGVDAGAVDAGGVDAGGDDGGSDAGPPPVDAGSDAGPPRPPSLCGTTHAAREFCDSFETGDLSRWTSSDAEGMGRITPVTDVVYRGSHAMRFECPRGCSYALAGVTLFSGTTPTEFWTRAYYYIPSTHPPSIEHLQIGDSDFFQSAVAAIWSSSVVNWHAHDYLGGAYHDTSYAVPLDRWVCVEMHVRPHTMGGGVELFWEDALVHSDLSLDGAPNAMNTIDSMYTGVVYKDFDDDTMVVYVDEVVADDSRIGCDP